MSLVPNSIRVRQRVEDDRVCSCTVPSFRTSHVLNEIYPPIRLRYTLMLGALQISYETVLRHISYDDQPAYYARGGFVEASADAVEDEPAADPNEVW